MPDKSAETNEVAVSDAREITGFVESRENVQLLKNTLSSQNLTDSEFKLFLYQVKRTRLDPLARQIYAMKTGGRLTMVTSIDGYRLIAERTGQYLGQTKTEWGIDAEGNMYASVGVIKKIGSDKETTYATAWFDEYAKPGYNGKQSMWDKMPKLMIAKVAEALALRKAFPQELGGLYTDDEMHQAEVEPAPQSHYEEPARDVNADIHEAEEAEVSDAPQYDLTRMGTEKQIKFASDMLRKKGATNLGRVKSYLSLVPGVRTALKPEDLSAGELKAVIDFLLKHSSDEINQLLES